MESGNELLSHFKVDTKQISSILFHISDKLPGKKKRTGRKAILTKDFK